MVSKAQLAREQNPVWSLTPDEITGLQNYLQKVKQDKIAQSKRFPKVASIKAPRTATRYKRRSNCSQAQTIERPEDESSSSERDDDSDDEDWRDYRIGTDSEISTRDNRRSDREFDHEEFRGHHDSQNYHNPYECGSRQHSEPVPMDHYIKPKSRSDHYNRNRRHHHRYPKSRHGHIRDIDAETDLWQAESTSVPHDERVFGSETHRKRLTEHENDRFDDLPYNPQDPRHIVWERGPRCGVATRRQGY